MVCKRTLNFKEKLELLIRFDKMLPSELENIARDNNLSITDLRSQLQEDCYHLNKVCNEDLESLNEALKHLPNSEIEAIEKLNKMPFAQIKDILERKAEKYNAEKQITCHLMEAWEIKESQIHQQLINEGLVNREDNGQDKGVCIKEFKLVSKRIRKEKAVFLEDIAKKINSDCSVTFTIDQIS